jgi:hypothetical protein
MIVNSLTNPFLKTGTYWISYLTDNNGLGFWLDFSAAGAFCGANFNFAAMPAVFPALTLPRQNGQWSFYATLLGGPFGGVLPNVPTTIICSAYDLGGSGVGYHYTANGGQTAANAYRTDGSQNLVAQTDTSSSNPWYLGYGGGGSGDITDTWTAYTVNVPTGGFFSFSIRCGTAIGATIHLSIDGVDLPVVSVPAHGSFGNANEWQTVSVPGNFTMSSGTHLIKLYVDTLNIDFNAIYIVPQVPSISVSSSVQAIVSSTVTINIIPTTALVMSTIANPQVSTSADISISRSFGATTLPRF